LGFLRLLLGNWSKFDVSDKSKWDAEEKEGYNDYYILKKKNR